jgi:alanyl-tRNA synthetase
VNTSDIRRLWIDFFAERGHRHVPSSSLIPPPEERTLLFTNAGMNQMKPYFMAMAEPPARRMTSIQKCFRTSDIEEVGDSSHCTFFEMLGNFSVGDYFKAEVIPWAWELLTEPAPKGMGLAKDRLWATIFQDDDEAFQIWRSVGVPAERIVRYGEKENYWFMGRVGPCGPNTEINYDFGAEFGCLNADCHPNCERPKPDGSGPCDRFLELWNLVFMTLFQDEDGSRRPLPMQNVDTGAGLERWSPVLLWQDQVDWQGNPKRWGSPPNIYDTDLFRPIIARLEELTGISYDAATDEQRRAMRVVAEHTRSAAFLIADGVTPANDGRGYVLRRLIRRGTSFGQRLKSGTQFLESTARGVIDLILRDLDPGPDPA